jgi:hypothetical protein
MNPPEIAELELGIIKRIHDSVWAIGSDLLCRRYILFEGRSPKLLLLDKCRLQDKA